MNSCDEPQSGSDSGQSSLKWEDVIRHAVLKSRSTGQVPGHDDNGLMLSPVEACCGDKEMSMDEVRSEGLRQWNMDMDVECQYETFNGLPVYYGGDLCDSEELEEHDTLDLACAAYAEDDNFDAPEGMDLMTYTHSRPNGGEIRGVDTVDMVYMCQTVSWAMPRAQDEPDRTSEMDALDIEELDIEGFCRFPDLWEEEDPSVSSDGLHVNIGLDMSTQNGLHYVDVASMKDFDATDDNSDTGSVAELEWNTWDDACAWEFRSASGKFPPELDLNPPAELLRNNCYYTDDDGSPEGLGHGGYVDGGIYPPRLCLWQQRSLWDSGIRNDDSMIIQRLNHKQTIYWHIVNWCGASDWVTCFSYLVQLPGRHLYY